MTTESQHDPRRRGGPLRGGSVLLGAAVLTLLLGLALTAAGALTAGSSAAYGALAGTVIVVLVLAFGAGTVHLVAGLMPAASLLVALLTYTLQVVALALVFIALSGSGLLDEALDRRWLAAAVIAGTLAWLSAQIVLVTRLRIPVYDLPGDTAPERPEAGAR